ARSMRPPRPPIALEPAMVATSEESLSWQVMAKLSSVSRVRSWTVRPQTRGTRAPVRNGSRAKPGDTLTPAAALPPTVEPVQRGGFESLAQIEGVQRPYLGQVRPDCLDRTVKSESVGDHGAHNAGGQQACAVLRRRQARCQW